MSVVVVDPATGNQFYTVGGAPFSPAIREMVSEITWIEILNESPYLLFAQLGSLVFPIPAWYGYPIPAPADGVGFNLPLSLSPLLLGTTANAPSSVCVVTVYGVGERPAQPQPYTLVRQANIGSNVAVSSINTLKNDGNSPNTQLIESTPSDQGVSAEFWNNDASGTEQILSANVQRIVRKNTRGDTGTTKAIIQFGDAGDTTITTLNGTATNANNLKDDAGDVSFLHRTGVAGNRFDLLQLPQPATEARSFGVRTWDGSASHDLVLATGMGLRQADVAPGGFTVTNGLTVSAGGATVTGASSFDAGNLTTDGTGVISKVAGQATAGAFGVALIGALTKRRNVVNTTNTSIATWTNSLSVIVLVRVWLQAWIGAANTNNGILTCTYTYTDPDAGVTTGTFLTPAGVSLSAATQTKGTLTRTAVADVLLGTGPTLTIFYQNTAAGTISDFVTASIEVLG